MVLTQGGLKFGRVFGSRLLMRGAGGAHLGRGPDSVSAGLSSVRVFRHLAPARDNLRLTARCGLNSDTCSAALASVLTLRECFPMAARNVLIRLW